MNFNSFVKDPSPLFKLFMKELENIKVNYLTPTVQDYLTRENKVPEIYSVEPVTQSSPILSEPTKMEIEEAPS